MNFVETKIKWIRKTEEKKLNCVRLANSEQISGLDESEERIFFFVRFNQMNGINWIKK